LTMASVKITNLAWIDFPIPCQFPLHILYFEK
jgi:hypothetical protein